MIGRNITIKQTLLTGISSVSYLLVRNETEHVGLVKIINKWIIYTCTSTSVCSKKEIMITKIHKKNKFLNWSLVIYPGTIVFGPWLLTSKFNAACNFDLRKAQILVHLAKGNGNMLMVQGHSVQCQLFL